MLFNSYSFILFFLPLVFAGFCFFGNFKNRKPSCLWLVFTSLFFYGWWNIRYCLLIIFSILANYSFAELIHLKLDRKKSTRFLLIFGVTLNLAILAYFKYTNFFIDNINLLFSCAISIQKIILPIALSFYTFEQIAFLVDTARGEVKRYPFVDYCFFVTFFPRLIAGPIIRHNEVLNQLEKPFIHQPQIENVSIGLSYFIIGLFKKVIIADQLANIANPIFDTAATQAILSTNDSWLGALAYTGQLYFDFSGYSDMAIGLARIFNITLPLNFNSPYQSTSIIDFWHNWNISLSRFLRDYLYIPLGGNKNGKMKRYLNLVITMLLGGLWHGANWTFVIWGGLHGCYLLLNHCWRHLVPATLMERLANTTSYNIICWLITFICAVIAWVFFRAPNIKTAFSILSAMFHLSNLGLPSTGRSQYLLVLLTLNIAFLLPNANNIFRHFQPTLDGNHIAIKSNNIKCFPNILTWSPSFIWSIIISILSLISFTFINHASTFIYFDF